MSTEELERWNRRFAAPFLAAQAGLFKPGQRALCVADGEGRNSVWLASRGGKGAPSRATRRRSLKYGTGGPQQVEQLYTEKLRRQAFGSLEIVELNAYEAELDEGMTWWRGSPSREKAGAIFFLLSSRRSSDLEEAADGRNALEHPRRVHGELQLRLPVPVHLHQPAGPRDA